MMRSLFSGVAGLKAHQTKMDVIGNNIANVNTTAYKASSMVFSDLMSQTTQKASGANATTGTGGVNARQIGLGVKTGAISINMSGQGASQSTGNAFDMMITGSNFFVVNDGHDNYFTRDGSFYVDGAGNLAMSSTGYNVMGWGIDEETQTIKQDTVQPLRVMSEANLAYPPEATSKAFVSGILDKNDTNVTSTSGKAITLNFFDTLGYSYTAKMIFKQTSDPTQYTVEVEKVLGSDGKEVDISGLNFGTHTIAFDQANGKFSGVDGSTGTTTMNLPMGSVGSSFSDIEIDFSTVTMYDNNGTSTIGATSGDLDGIGTGRSIGKMIGVSVQNNGMIFASYDNGMTKLLGQMATAAFSNVSGLEKAGDNLYKSTMNSGEFDGIGVDITAGGGYISTGQLEMSNVDLSQEFTEMITTQRGFQANSRIITVSDTMIEELTNLKR